MIDRRGALATARELISKDGGTSGFTKLWECKRPALSLETLVISGKYEGLFNDNEKVLCRERLNEYGYKG